MKIYVKVTTPTGNIFGCYTEKPISDSAEIQTQMSRLRGDIQMSRAITLYPAIGMVMLGSKLVALSSFEIDLIED
jgi:hypothetical protein